MATIKSPRTNGQGDVGVIRRFGAAAGDYYTAAAMVSLTSDPDNPVVNGAAELTIGEGFWARLTIAGVNGVTQKNECNTWIRLPHVSKDGVTDNGQPEPVMETLTIPECRLATESTAVLIKIRAHSNNTSWGGTAAFHSLSFRRCQTSGCPVDS